MPKWNGEISYITVTAGFTRQRKGGQALAGAEWDLSLGRMGFEPGLDEICGTLGNG